MLISNSTRDLLDLKDFFSGRTDPRTEGYLFLGNTLVILGFTFGHIVFATLVGPRHMKDRPPYNLRKLKMCYNLAQIIACTWLFCQLGFGGWFGGYSWRCQPLDFSADEKSMKMVNSIYWCFILKLVDFLDTVFLLGAGRLNDVTFLHVYHRTIMAIFGWAISSTVPVGHITLLIFLDIFIHLVVHISQLMAALGPPYKGKTSGIKLVPFLQILWCILVFANSYAIISNPDCNYPVYVAYWAIFGCVTFFVLYVDLCTKGDEKKVDHTGNGYHKVK